MGNVVARVATQLLRFINYHVRHWSEQLRNPETRQQLYYPLTIGCGGAFAGSLIRRQLGAYVATFSAVWFISNFLIDYDFIKVNWERVDQVRNALPMIDYAVQQYQVLKEYAQSIPMSGVFGAGFAIGFYYL
ncbi:hypothetical protein MIR68_003561 [Amoeboaphelidium protococcarum]|nr:hypothetical protein MIR68_003561 [Amoeboaphelidium protococcarum]